MKKITNKYKVLLMVSIFLISISVIGFTFSYYYKNLFSDLTVSTITKGLDYYINYTHGQNINVSNLTPVSGFNEGVNTSVNLYKKDNTYDIYGQIYLDISSIGNNLSNSRALKYKITSNNNFSYEGTFQGKTSGSSILIGKNIPLTTAPREFNVFIWLDENEEINPNATGESFGVSIRCEATMTQI